MCCYCADHEMQERQYYFLKYCLTRILLETSSSQAILVGYSMGGILVDQLLAEPGSFVSLKLLSLI